MPTPYVHTDQTSKIHNISYNLFEVSCNNEDSSYPPKWFNSFDPHLQCVS